MSKSRVCVEKTINLAKQNRVKKTNLLTYEKQRPANPYVCLEPDSGYKPAIQVAPIRKIKICTGAEMKKLCPPEPAPRAPPLTLAEKLRRLFLFGMKSLLAAGLVYTTIDMGIWDDTQTSRELYDKILCAFVNIVDTGEEECEVSMSGACEEEKDIFNVYASESACQEQMKIDDEQNTYDFRRRWNKLVFAIFTNLIEISRGTSPTEEVKEEKDECGDDDN